MSQLNIFGKTSTKKEKAVKVIHLPDSDITVNSLSGGKTSSYMAVHYPSDYELFALVCNDDPLCAHPDKKLMQRANDKLSKYTPHFGEFIGTPEDYVILNTMFDLEQKIGREIIWLRGESFEEVMFTPRHNILPNRVSRFCTQEMKLWVIFWFTYLHIGAKVKMRVGFRTDEQERALKFKDTSKMSLHCDLDGKHANEHRWQHICWRVPEWVLIDNHVFHGTVVEYWTAIEKVIFAADSNCLHCFWKAWQQLRKNFEVRPAVMQWAKRMEARMSALKETSATFNKEYSLAEIEKMALPLDFEFGGGSGCQAGFCTD